MEGRKRALGLESTDSFCPVNRWGPEAVPYRPITGRMAWRHPLAPPRTNGREHALSGEAWLCSLLSHGPRMVPEVW